MLWLTKQISNSSLFCHSLELHSTKCHKLVFQSRTENIAVVVEDNWRAIPMFRWGLGECGAPAPPPRYLSDGRSSQRRWKLPSWHMARSHRQGITVCRPVITLKRHRAARFVSYPTCNTFPLQSAALKSLVFFFCLDWHPSWLHGNPRTPLIQSSGAVW